MTSMLNPIPHDKSREATQKYNSIKAQLQAWINMLAGNVTAKQGAEILQSLNQSITALQGYVAVVNLNVAAQSLFADATFDQVAQLNTMITDLQAIVTWITANIPNPSYTPTQTAPVLALIQTAYNDAV